MKLCELHDSNWQLYVGVSPTVQEIGCQVDDINKLQFGLNWFSIKFQSERWNSQ